MKITKNQIKQIILEELDAVLNEQGLGLGRKPRSLGADVPAWEDLPIHGVQMHPDEFLGPLAKTSPEEVVITPTPGDAPPVLTKVTKDTPIVPGMPKKQVWSILTKRGHDWRSKWWVDLPRRDQSRVEYRAWWSDFTLKRDKDRLERHRRDLDKILALNFPGDLPASPEVDPEAHAVEAPGIAAFGGAGVSEPASELASVGEPEEEEERRRIPPLRGVARPGKTD